MRLAEGFGLKHIATGDILRETVKKGGETADQIRKFIDKGELVPDEIIVQIIKGTLLSDEAKRGFTLDGFPRNINQARILDDMMRSIGWEFDYIFNVWAEKKNIVDRIVNRLQCANCNTVYNLVDNPPKNDTICDVCGNHMRHRPDDDRKTVLRRFEVYEMDTAPVVEHYRDRSTFYEIYTGGPVGLAEKDMLKIIREDG